MPRLPMTIPPSLDDLTPDVPASVFNETFRRACERLDGFIGALVVELALGLELGPGEVPPVERLFAERRWLPSTTLPVRWLLETLELYGTAERRGDGWLLRTAPPPVASAQLRAEAERLLPAARPAYEVLSLSAASLPGVLQGRLRGEDALFGPASLGLWFEYFSNANPHYAPNNALTALAIRRAAAPRPRVLEVGGGGGSAAQLVLRALAEAGNAPEEYVFTEPQPAFLRRGVRALQKEIPEGCEFRSQRFDIDVTPGDQGLDGARFDVVFGVNTVHLARDVVGTLRRLRGLLRPGGVMVLGELLRPTPTAAVHLELPFSLLGSYGEVALADGIRERPGFMSAAGWGRALREAGFDQVTTLPERLQRCVEVYPGFYCGAITAHA